MPVAFLCMGAYGIPRDSLISTTSAAPDCAVMSRFAMPDPCGHQQDQDTRTSNCAFADCRVLAGVLASGETAPGHLENSPAKVLMLLQLTLYDCVAPGVLPAHLSLRRQRRKHRVPHDFFVAMKEPAHARA